MTEADALLIARVRGESERLLDNVIKLKAEIEREIERNVELERRNSELDRRIVRLELELAEARGEIR